MSIVKLVLFDIVGTMIKDHGEVIDAFSIALTANGMTVNTADLKEFQGASKRDVIRRFVERHWSDDPCNPERIDPTERRNSRSEASSGMSPIAYVQ